jgi:hypothetical protein
MSTPEPSRAVTKRKCVTCRKTFRPARRDARYCSGRCRQAAHRARTDADDLDREIEAARLRYWELIAQKAKALGRSRSDVLTGESQYVDLDGTVYVGGVLGGGECRRLAGRLPGPNRAGWTDWGLEAAGPPWAPPTAVPDIRKGFFESAILGRKRNGR